MCLTSPSSSVFPFHKLPRELKLEIFLFDALIVDLRDSNRQRMRKRAMTLATVSPEWNEIVSSLPQLWSTIYINVYERDSKEVFDMYIKNLKTLPLDVSIYFGHHDHELEVGSYVSKGLLREAYRLKFLEISFGTLWHWQVDNYKIYRNVTRLLTGDLPLLEAAYLSADGSVNDIDNSYGISLHNMFGNSPRLGQLRIALLDHFPGVFTSCTQVTELILTSVSIEFCIDAITSLPNLTHLTVMDMTYTQEYPASCRQPELPPHFKFKNGSTVFLHDALKSLKFTTDHDDIAILFLRSISCPSLKRLLICKWDLEAEEDVIQAAVQFLRVSNCPLQDLDLRMDHLDGIWPLFDTIHTTVETLKLHTHCSLSGLVPVFINNVSSPSYFPHIRKVNISEYAGPLDYAAIYSQLKQRMDSWTSWTPIGPSVFNVMLKKHAAKKDSDDRDPVSTENIDVEIVNGFRELSEKGLKVCIKVRSESLINM